jgi:beta-glucanase (GH16 family)
MVDGALTGTVAVDGPGRTLEFVATFTGDPWQHIGFGIDYSASPWIIFSTAQGGQLYARTATEDGQTLDTVIPGSWFGAPHRYRIDWQPTQVIFSIDGTVVATHTVSIGLSLHALISDFNVSGGALTVGAIGMFTSVSRVEFSTAPSLPGDWFSTAWSVGGVATVTNGKLTVDGALTGTVAAHSPGLSLEFVATFTGDPWQHIGFGIDYSAAPWIIFSTAQGGQLYARTATEAGQALDTVIAGHWFSTAHRYRIDWQPTQVVFSIDGAVVATHAAPIRVGLQPLVSDFDVSSGYLTVDWLEMIVPIFHLDFSDTSLSPGWSSGVWENGGTAQVANGLLRLDGALAGTLAVYSPGRVLELVATLTGDPWQHIGFGMDYSAAPWIIFSTFQGDQLYARTTTAAGQALDTAIPGTWFGAPHRYRIDWQPTQVVFSIDGTVVATHAAPPEVSLRPLMSDFTVGGGILTIDSLEMTP